VHINDATSKIKNMLREQLMLDTYVKTSHTDYKAVTGQQM